MYQAHARELLNQKDTGAEPGLLDASGPLGQATERLRAALDRLEGRVSQALECENGAENPEQLLFFERENESLRAERDSLNAAIDELKSQYDGLHKAASTIYNKLNDSIKRLTQIIGD